MTYDEAKELIREHTDYGGNVDAEGLAEALATPSAENRPEQEDVRDQTFEMFFESAWRRGDCIEDEKPAMLRAWNAAIASQSAKEKG